MSNKLLVLLFFLMGLSAHADSPLTSSDFWKVYSDIPEVAKAGQTHRLDAELADFLVSAKPIDQKAAVINALSWSDQTSPRNFNLLRQRLGKKYKLDADKIDTKLNAEEAFCLGYLTAMDSYHSPNFALGLMRQASAHNRSYTIAIITGLVEAQCVFGGQSRIWTVFAKQTEDSNLRMDMREEAKESILSYMRLYQRS